MVSVRPKNEQLQDFDGKQLNSVAMVYPNFVLFMQESFFAVPSDILLNQIAPLLLQWRENK